MRAEVISSEADLAGIADSWRGLAEATGNPFVTPDWFLAALATVERGAEPAVAAAFGDDGGLRGVLPLLRPAGGGPVTFAATRYADRLQPAAAPGDEDEVAEAVAGALADHLGARTALDLGRVDSKTTWCESLARGWPGRRALIAQPPDPMPMLSLEGLSWDDYLASRSGQFRNQVKRKRKGLERDHEVNLRRTSEPEVVERDIETLFALHDARWGAREGDSSLGDPGARQLLVEFAKASQAAGWLRLFVFEVDGTAVAAWYGWRVGGRYSYYQAGFDPDWSRQSVGFLLLAETIRAAIEEGAREYDLLWGDEAFKSRFTNGMAYGRRVTLAPPVSGARMRSSAMGIARLGRRALRRGRG
jgi:CelD/BcsL family acetyltransferase involved in cellulose biosynthesis